MQPSELSTVPAPSTPLENHRRPECQLCWRALCICHLKQQQNNRLRLLIWQHPNEARHVKGTARLLHLCLENSELVIAKSLSADELRRACALPELSHAALLYPSSGQGEFTSRLSAQPAAIACLILIDASWRDSREILRNNPYLLDLPRYALQQNYAGQYQIRKAHKPGQLSSMEAGLYALQELRPAEIDYAALFKVFAAFNQFQAQYFQAKEKAP